MTLRFSYSVVERGGSRKREKSFDMTWDEIFLAIASKIPIPRSTGLISSYVSSYLRESRGFSTHYSLFDADEAVVKNQLVALGLVDAYVGTTLGEGASHEFMRLTAKGRMKLSEALAIPTTVPHHSGP